MDEQPVVDLMVAGDEYGCRESWIEMGFECERLVPIEPPRFHPQALL